MKYKDCITVFACFSVFAMNVAARAETVQLGDLAPRGAIDGVVDVADLNIMQQLVIGEITATSNELLIGDVAPLAMPDGVIDVADLLVMQRAALGEISLGTTEIDTTPPRNIDLSKFDVDTTVPGELTISGFGGSVEPGATIEIINLSTSEAYTITADENGAFSVVISGNSGDMLSLTVKDGAGNVSGVVQYKVGIIWIVSPIDNSSISDGFINVRGAFAGTVNSGVQVNGEVACVRDNAFYINHVKLQPGINDISAILTLPDGTRSTQIIQFTSTASSDVDISISDYCGVSPLTAKFEINNTGNSGYNVYPDFDGDGNFDTTLNSVPEFDYVYDQVGLIIPEIEVSISGQHFKRRFYVVVLGEDELGGILESVWAALKDALLSGNVNEALSSISSDSHYLYGPVFEALLPHMGEIVTGWSGIEPLNISDTYASYAVLRVTNDQPQVFFINFKRDRNGIWKIESF